MDQFFAAFGQNFEDFLAIAASAGAIVLFVWIALSEMTKGRKMIKATATVSSCELIRKRSFLNDDDSYRVVLSVPGADGRAFMLTIDDTSQRYEVGTPQPVRYFGPDPQSHFMMTHNAGAMLALTGLGAITVPLFAYLHFAAR